MKKHLSLVALLASSPIYAAIENPPLFKNTSMNPDVVEVNLDVNFKKGKIYNPNANKFDKVKLRQYIDPKNTENHSFVSPTMRVQQGQTLRVNLTNKLISENKNDQRKYLKNCPDQIQDMNIPHCFNSTNLHTHGLWVDPGTNANGTISDNVFEVIKPGENRNYEFKIDKQHPAGTYWYHPHLHGSTSLQVLSGMAGALIIEGNRMPTQNNNGDIDILLKDTPEQIFVFQQIQYKCPNNKCTKPGSIKEDYDTFGTALAWSKSKRYTSINGNVGDTLKVQANQYYRWRMIHGGIRETIGLMIKEISPDQLKKSAGNVVQACQTLGEFLDDPTNPDFNQNKINFQSAPSLEFHTIAYDGITTKEIQTKKLSVLQPGYREDVLISFNPNKKYCIFDTKLADKNEINKFHTEQKNTTQQNLTLPQQHGLYAQLLATVDVTESSIPQTPIREYLVNLAKGLKLDDSIINNIQQVKDNLRNFTPHESLTDIDKNQVGKQELNFNIANTDKDFGFGLGISNHIFDIASSLPYGQNMNRYLKLNSIDEWTLTSTNGGHPFHIHVNPFQIKAVYKVKMLEDGSMMRIGKDISTEAGTDLLFNGLNGVWKDTLFVPQGYEVVVRTKYEKYSGDFVLHCHILNHEDLGMMQNVRICDPNKIDSECKKREFKSHNNEAQGTHLLH